MADAADLRAGYIELLKKSLMAQVNGPLDLWLPLSVDKRRTSWWRRKVQETLVRRGRAVLAYRGRVDPAADPDGRTFVSYLPPGIMTMIGSKRMDSLRDMVIDVIERDVPGDCIETGVWRGGACIFMRGILRAYGSADRTVYVADSFQGLPAPDAEKYPADEGLDLYKYDELAVGLEDVRANFERYGLLDDQVVFVKGWFRDTLPGLRDRRWALIRLDGDLYESTMDGLVNLYPQLSPGGWIIIDDWQIPACAQAVHDYRTEKGITEEIVDIDGWGVCWQKQPAS